MSVEDSIGAVMPPASMAPAMTGENPLHEDDERDRAGGRIPWARIVGPLIVFGLFIGFWYLAHYVLMEERRKFLIPPPHEVVRDSFLTWSVSGGESLANIAGGGLSDQLDGLWLSTKVAMLGLSIAIVLGIALATLMSQAKWIEQSIYPYLVALQAIPILAFVPLIGVLWGFNFRSRVLVTVIIALFPIVANTLFGLLSVDRGYHELMTLNGASRWTRLRKLQFPAAMPSIFTGLQISAGLSVIGAVVGDFFFRQGQPGIGQLIDRYRASLAYSQMYGAVILASLLGIVVFWFFGWLSHKVVGHWYESRGG
jgi:NitT/TauT family transport system permease protein